MSATWEGDTAPDPVRITPLGWLRAALRGTAIVALILAGLALLLPLRLIERAIWGARRPLTPWIVQGISRTVFVILGMRHRVDGRPMQGSGAVVSNHASWLDIFALNARKRVYFVSKAEVAGWPGIGFLARVTGTLFIERDRRQAQSQVARLADRLAVGDRLLFFPEGTSTDGLRVLPFKPTLFAAFFTSELRQTTRVQPVTVIYRAPPGQPSRFYGWWGDMALVPHLARVLAAPRGGQVTVVYHPPRLVADFDHRKALAASCEQAVRDGFDRGH
jgi:1-acyl-sn-glycerol-3-phosphate acyltransferase